MLVAINMIATTIDKQILTIMPDILASTIFLVPNLLPFLIPCTSIGKPKITRTDITRLIAITLASAFEFSNFFDDTIGIIHSTLCDYRLCYKRF